jgi:hypothetical protein
VLQVPNSATMATPRLDRVEQAAELGGVRSRSNLPTEP